MIASYPVTWIRVPLLTGLLVFGLLAGCQDPTTSSSAQSTSPWLSHWTPNSSVFVVNHQPLADGDFDRIARWMNLTLQALYRGRRFTPVRQTLEQLTDADAWRDRGLDPNGYFALYEQGGMFWAQIPILDESIFQAWWQQQGWPNDSGQLGPITSIGYGFRVELYRDHITIGWSPHDENPLIPSLDVGSGDGVRAKQWFDETHQRHAFDGVISGLIRPAALLTTLTPTPECQDSAQEWTEPWDLWVFGTTQMDAQELSWSLQGQMGAFKEIQTTRITSPTIDPDAMRSVMAAEVAGLAWQLDVVGLRTWALKHTEPSMSACQPGSRVESGRQELRRWANRPIPPMITSIQGFTSRFDGLHKSPDRSAGAPRYDTALYLQNPGFILGLAQLFSPSLGTLDLRPDQPAERLPEEALAGLIDWPVYLSTTPQAIRISDTPHGHQASRSDERIISADQNTSPIWLAGALDFERLDELAWAIDQTPLAMATETPVDTVEDWIQKTGIKRLEWLVMSQGGGLTVDVRMLAPSYESAHHLEP